MIALPGNLSTFCDVHFRAMSVEGVRMKET